MSVGYENLYRCCDVVLNVINSQSLGLTAKSTAKHWQMDMSANFSYKYVTALQISISRIYIFDLFSDFFNIIFLSHTQCSVNVKKKNTKFLKMYLNLTVIVPNVLVLKVALSISCFFNFDLTCLISHPHWIIDLWCPKGRYHLWNLNLLFKKGNIKNKQENWPQDVLYSGRCRFLACRVGWS